MLFILPFLLASAASAVFAEAWGKWDISQIALLVGTLMYGFFAGWIMFVIIRYHVSLRMIMGPVPRGAAWLWSISILPVVLAQCSFFVLSVAADPEFPLTKVIVRQDEFGLSPGLFFWNCGFMMLIGPVIEELTFRGILLNRFICKWGVRSGILVTSVLFAALHPFKIEIFVFALLMALLYLKTRSLLIPMLCHVLNNLIAGGLTYLMVNSPRVRVEITAAGGSPWLWLGLLVAGYGITCAVIYGLWRTTVSPVPVSAEAVLRKREDAVEFNY